MTKECASIRVRLTLMEEMLGTAPNDESIYNTFIAKKAPDGKDVSDESKTLPNPEADNYIGAETDDDDDFQGQMTVFHRDPESGGPIIYDYLIKGFFKNACSVLRNCTGTQSSKIKAFKKYIDGLVFINERRIKIDLKGENITLCQRPLRAQTAKGERTALSCSEAVPAGSTMDFTITCLKGDMLDQVVEWLDYGRYNGLGQWHNSGKGRFTWEQLPEEETA